MVRLFHKLTLEVYAVPKLCGKALKNFLLGNIVVEIIVRYSALVCDSQILLVPHSISFFSIEVKGLKLRKRLEE